MLEGLTFGTLDMPFLYADEAQAHAVLDGPVGQTLFEKLAAKNVIGLGFAEGGFRHMINNVRPVETPDDVGGVKYRVMQNPVFIGMFSGLGGNAVPMAWGETYTAVQQGTIDGLEILIAVIHSSKFQEVAKYLPLTRHTYSAIALLMSKRTYDRLSDDERAAVRAAAAEAIAQQRAEVAANVEVLIDELRAAGMEVNEVADPAAFRERVTDVYAEFRPLLLIGAVMDNITAMIILGAVLTNIGAQLGLDPIHLGAIVVVNFAIGMATPPFG